MPSHHLLRPSAILWWRILAWLLAIGLVTAAFYAGVHAPYIFDDQANLEPLRAIRGDAGAYEYLRYAFSGVSSHIGRPIALLSFALQHESWPDHPEHFLIANLAIHLFNAGLLALCLFRLLRLAGMAVTPATNASLIASCLWAAAPIHVGAVLYAVQRMALLSGTFCLAGLLLYLIGRGRLAAGKWISATLLMGFGVGLGAGLGTFAKENAVLLPLLILILELTVLPPPPQARYWQLLCGIVLVLPTLLVLFYVGSQLPGLVSAFDKRAFSITERLLTEPRVLGMYLWKIIFPPLYSMRMYYDDYPVSRSLITPLSTLAGIAFWAGLVLLAFQLRRRFPYFAMAALWFVAAHLLEATVIPLEIAFDHRNYFAAIGPVVLIALLALRAIEIPLRAVTKGLVIGALIVYAGYWLVASWQSAKLRSQPLQQALYWSQTQPDSIRAQIKYAVQLAEFGYLQEASSTFSNIRLKWPNEPYILTVWYRLGCLVPDINPPDTDLVAAKIRSASSSDFLQVVDSISGTIQFAHDESCPTYSLSELETLVLAATEAPNSAPWRRNLYEAYAYAMWANKDRAKARQYLDKSIRLRPRFSSIRQGVYWAIESGDIDAAKDYLTMLEETPSISQLHRWANREHIKGLKQLVAITEEYHEHYRLKSPNTGRDNIKTP